jgi:hypothetical protein
MKQIHLSQGKFAIVDDEDFPSISQFKWCFRRDKSSSYAVRHHKPNGKDRLLYLHRELMKPDANQSVIFLNHDSLDCRRENLLVASHEQARWHHRVRKDSKSGIKGVRYHPDTDTWSAYVYRQGRCIPIGTFLTKEEASSAYQAEVRKEAPELHGAPKIVQRAGMELAV